VTLSALRGRQLLFRPGLMVQGAMAHYTAGALLSAPGVLGSLELLLNPTGLLHSMSAGMADLLGLPLAALMAGSPAQVGTLCSCLIASACLQRLVLRMEDMHVWLRQIKCTEM
jgi:hypothetical protein